MEIREIIAAVQSGTPVVILDDRKEMEGDLFCAAANVELEVVHFMIRRCSGFLCLAMPRERLEQIGIPRVTDVLNYWYTVQSPEDQRLKPDRFHLAETPFHFPVDRKGLHSGISVMDRYETIKALLGAEAEIAQFECPGHLPLLGAHPQGLAGRIGHTEAAVDLCQMAGLQPAGLLCEICDEDGTMARGEYLEQFAKDNALPLVTMSQLVEVSSPLPF